MSDEPTHYHTEGCTAHAVNTPAGLNIVVAWECADGFLRNSWSQLHRENPDSEDIAAAFIAAEQVLAAIEQSRK